MIDIDVKFSVKAIDLSGAYLVPLDDVKSEMSRVIRNVAESAFMAGQSDCGVDPSYSSAKKYADSILYEG